MELFFEFYVCWMGLIVVVVVVVEGGVVVFE